MSKKQATLFQSWGNKAKGTDDKPAQPYPQPSTSSAGDEVIDLCWSFEDDDDDILCEAEVSAANNSKSTGQTFANKDDFRDVDGKEVAEIHLGDISIGAEGFTPTQVQTQSSICPGFDKCAGKLWIYPTNYPVREYQFNIVQKALFKNTMVTLPTGLGKTFIAAVVMYNFYRWYPQGKVIFMAPTKPLVAQQIEACYNIMGIPQDHTAEMTGSMGPSKREKAWHEKRVFFLTPQVLTNDLSRGSCPANDVKCLVIDEAHKALGNHAYCQVVRELVKYTENFRILALSATPGSDIKAVQQVLSNLLISQIEIRTEESADIKRYSHERKVEKVVVPLGDELTKVKTRYISIMEVVVNRLKRYGVLYNKDTTSLSKFLILKAREAFRQNPPERLPRNQYGIVEGDFALAMSLYHGYELLQLHGSRSLYNFLDGILTGDKGYGRTRTELTKNADFNELMGVLSGKYTKPDGETASQTRSKPFVIGHPKMEKLQEIVLDHFNTHRDATTRVMIFSQYRDSVQEITDMLHVHRPVVKVMSFIGQATAGKSTKGFTQKEQLKVMKQFREGGYNTLVSTCVGEEGLDIGDVDLIICFDAHKSPIRLVQRMGRTGRKREGRIVMLVTQGKEEQIYNQSQYSKKSIHKAILNGAKSLHFYQHSPRMLPDNYTPTCHKMHITVKENFRPTKKITCEKDLNQSKITSMMSDAASKKTHTVEVITLEEYRELEPWLVPEENIPKLPTCTTVCLESEEPDENEMERGKFLSLSEWSPWQNTLQDTVFLDHSMASRHLVQLMEFVQLQQSLESNEDAYGLEMAAYLNEEDILQPGETDVPSIVKSYVPKQNKNKEDSISNRQNKGGKAKSRRSDSLPKFDFLNNDSNNSSDDDLPAFNVELGVEKNTSVSDRRDLTNKVEVNCNNEENETVSEIRTKTDTACLRKDMNEAMEISDDERILSSELSSNKEDTLSTFPVERKKKLFESKAKSLEKKMNVEKVRKRKKSLQISEQTSVIKLIADSDSNDFDGVTEVSVNFNEEHSLRGIHKNAEQHKVVFSSKEGSKSSSDHSCSVTEMINEVKNDTSGDCFRISSPPLVENVEYLVEAIGREVDFKTFDIFAVLDEWHLENKDGKYISYPEIMKKSILHHHDETKSTQNNTQKKSSDPVADTVLTGSSLHDITDRSTKSSSSDTSVEIDPCKEKYPEKVKVKNDKDSESIGSANRNSDLKTLKDPNIEMINQKTTLFISQNKTSVEQKTELNKENKSNESLTVCGDTKTVEQEESDDFACTGNFMLNADDVLFTNDDWLDEEMEEYSMYSKQKPQVLENDKTTPKYLYNSYQCSNKPQDIKDKDRKEHIYVCESGSTLLNEVYKVDNIDTQESFVNIYPKGKLSSSTKFVTNCPLSMPFSTEKETNYDSFANDKDDEIFMDLKTPVNNSQITFTQALNFVHSGNRISGSESCSDSSFKDSDVHPSKDKSLKKASPKLILESSDKADQKLGIEFLEECKISSNMGGDPVFSENKSELLKEKTELFLTERVNSRKSSSTSEEGVEMPEFDLGFDFDEDIIPPSPESTQISQKPSTSRLSQTFMFTHRLGQNNYASDDLTSESKGLIVHEAVDSKRIDQKTNVSSVTQEVKSKKSCNLQNQQNAAFVKPFLDKDEESQSLLDDQVPHSIKHKVRLLGSLHLFGKADLEPILENEVKDAKFSTKMMSSGNKVNKSENQNQELENEQEQSVRDEFDASFALLGEDLDDWIDSGIENNVKTNQKAETVPQKESVKERNDNSVNGQFHKTSPFNRQSILASQDRLYTPVATVNPISLSHDPPDMPDRKQDNYTSKAGKSKLVRKSIFMFDDLPSDSFDDSFDFANDLVLGRNILKNNKSAIVQSHNTSTPMSTNKTLHIVTPCVGIETTPRKTNTEARKEKENFSPVSLIQHENNQDYHEVEPVAENDDSFIVRRKKKVKILDSPLSQENVSGLIDGRDHCENKIDSDLVFSCTKKAIQLSSSGSDDHFDDSFLLKKPRVKKSDPFVISNSSDDDFEEAVLQPNNQNTWKNATMKPKISFGNKEQSKVTKKVRSKCGVDRKRASNPFIEEEAELSEEAENAASSDEHEGSDLDAYEGSFIADSQLADSQALNQTDIHALYLKSVKSPQMQRGGFKLQFNQRDDIDVYSQRPPPEESHYMEDSFCVGSEEEDAWLMGEGDSEEESREMTLMQNSLISTGRKRRKGLQAFQTSRQREIQIGRMKALSEIRSKLAGKATNRAQQKQYTNQACEKAQKHKAGKRNRIQMQGDSSTDDESNFQFNISDLMSPKLQPTLNCNKRRRRVLSSDDSESEEFIENRSNKNNTNIQLTSRNELERGRNLAIANISSTSGKITAEEIRQERLKKQKEKQAEFKRLLEKKQIGHTDQNSTRTTSGLTKIKEKSEDTFQRNEFEFAKPTIEDKSETDLLLSSSVKKSKFSEKPKILVDSKEISGSQDIISDLRFKHDIIVSAAQLQGCDYVVSNRMAVERRQWSEFSNGANRSKLIERMQHLGELYDRPCLIVEKDRVKPGEEKCTRPVHWTKYVDRTLALLLRSEIKVMFTDSYTETAGVLADLCRLEQRKNMMINVPVDLNDEQLHRVKFFLSIPKLSYIHALNLCDGFKSVTEFIRSSIILIERLGKMSRNRATEVYNYLRRKFDPNMLPSSFK